MVLVKGLPITKYCDQEHLTPQERLQLFVPICHAVQHAHQKGIIHRDLKPSNILIALYDGVPVPKVIDFGVANATGTKLTERTLFTEVGHAIGTWEYMAPEQAEVNNLDIDTRADIYALGATLYELLTGSPPFTRQQLRNAGFEEMLRLIREVEPPKPSTRLSSSDELPALAAKRKLEPANLSRLVRGDLDWIVMKCLEKERGRRYETANGLAMDVQRYLADEAVLASPPSAAYRLRKFARRHKGKLLTSALFGLVLLLAAGSFGWALWDRAEQRAINRAEKIFQAKQNHALAEMSLARLDDLYKQYLWTEADALLDSAEKLVGPDGDAALRNRIAKAKRKTKLFHDLDQARQVRATWVQGKFNDAGAAVQYATAFRTFGLEVKPGQTEALARRIREEEPSVREALLAALDDWVYLDETALKSVLLALVAAADDDRWRQEFHKAVAAKDGAALARLSEQARRLPLASTNLCRLARMLKVLDHRDEAVALLRQARARFPADFWIALELGTLQKTKYAWSGDLDEQVGCCRVAVALRPRSSAAHINLGNALRDKKQLDEAFAEYKIAIELDPQNAIAHLNLGTSLHEKRQQDAAIAEFKIAIRLDPKNALAHNNLGLALRDKNQLDDAIAEFKIAIQLDPKHAPAHTNLGISLHDKKHFDEAIAEFKLAIKLDPNYMEAHYNLGRVFHHKKEFDSAISEFKKAIAIDPKNAGAHMNLGASLHDQKQLDAAIAEFRTAIDLDPTQAITHYNLGIALRDNNQLDDAIAEFKIATDLDPNHAPAHNLLANALYAKRQFEAAIAEHKIAIELEPKNAKYHIQLAGVLYDKQQWHAAIAEYNLAIDLDAKIAGAHNNLGNALLKTQQWDAAIAAFNKAIAIDPKFTLAYHNLGNALRDKKQLDAAIAVFNKAITFDPTNAETYLLLGIVLFQKKQLEDAAAAFREAIKIDSHFAEAYCNLGLILNEQAKFAGAFEALKKGHELGTKRGPAWRYPSAQWVSAAERMAKLEARLPAVLKGEDRVKDSADLQGFEQLCVSQKRHASAVKLYADAFVTDAKLADDMKALHRYNAAPATPPWPPCRPGHRRRQVRRQGARPPSPTSPRLAPCRSRALEQASCQ